MPCRIFKGLELLSLMCELGAVVCTLLYLFNLRRSSTTGYSSMDADETQRQITFTFVSLAITLVTATVKAIGVSKVAKAVRSVAVSIRSSIATALGPSQLFGPHSGTVKPICDVDEVAVDENTDAENELLTSVTAVPSTLDQGQDGDLVRSSVRRPSVAGLRPGGASEAYTSAQSTTEPVTTTYINASIRKYT